MPQNDIIEQLNQIDEFGLIFDRTIADVNLVKKLYFKGWQSMTDEEKQLWMTDLKGTLNTSDLNRVEEACEWINRKLQLFAYGKQLNIKKDWTESDFHEDELMIEYCRNVLKIITAIPNDRMASIKSNTSSFTYKDQNDIEKNLYLMRDVLISLAEGMKLLSFTLSGDEFE